MPDNIEKKCSRGKIKRRNRSRKPRHPVVSIGSTEQPIVIASIDRSANGEIRFLDEEGSSAPLNLATVGMAYLRAKGPKVLVQQPVDPSSIQLDPNRVLAQHAAVFAVDTNTREVRGQRVSVTAVVEIQVLALDPWTARLVPFPIAMEFHDVPCSSDTSPERIGWLFAMSAIAAATAPPFALVVDSDLGKIEAINSGREPVSSGIPRPDGVSFVYATSDAGTSEYIACAAIRHADRVSSEILDLLDRDGLGAPGSYDERGTLLQACSRCREIKLLLPSDE